MAKKFFSFLGTNNYQECVYQFQKKTGKKVVYIQDDLIDRFCTEFGKDDKIVFFLTKKAREKHWKDKLENIIINKQLKCQICPIDVMDSETESDIWGLFEQIYNTIEQNDEVIFDLTYSLRYLPMLFFSILHYSVFTKEISVKGIYYGAWEVKGEVNGETVSPIFDLTDTFNIMEWANAADAFTNYGIADKLVRCVNSSAKDFIGSSGLAKSISSMTKDILYSRTIPIAQGDKFKRVKEGIEKLEPSLQPPFKPILETVFKKIDGFKDNETKNFIPAVKWCIAHEMIPQGVTILQEGLLSYILNRCSLDYQNRNLRILVSGRLNQRDTQEYKPDSEEIKYKKEIDEIFKDEFVQECRAFYQSITQLRNDVNHGGTNEHATVSTEKLYNNLKNRFEEVRALCQKHSVY